MLTALIFGTAFGAVGMWAYYRYCCPKKSKKAEPVSAVDILGEEAMNQKVEDKKAIVDDMTKNGFRPSIFDYYKGKEEDTAEEKDIPYVISPDEFGTNEDYDTISLIYYADGVLTNDADEVIDNVEEIVGKKALNSFGEYEEDSVFVRNDLIKVDYEILRDLDTYEDMCKRYYKGR